MSNSIEFFVPDDGGPIYVHDGENMTLLNSKDELVEKLVDNVKENYPKAYDALYNIYGMAFQHKYLMISRFVRCNLSKHDNVVDFDGVNFNFERVSCPLRGGGCKHENIICHPEYDTKVSPAEMRVFEQVAKNYTDAEIAEILNLSVNTVNCHRKKLLQKLNCKNKAELILHFKKHHS